MTQEYPVLLKRIQALLIDSLLLILCMILLSQLITFFNGVASGIRVAAFILIFFLYDPLMTSTFGGTLGHMAMGIRVKKESGEDKNIHFMAALLRFATKTLFGWISLLTITGNKRKRAMHDMISGSVVVFKTKSVVSIPG